MTPHGLQSLRVHLLLCGCSGESLFQYLFLLGPRAGRAVCSHPLPVGLCLPLNTLTAAPAALGTWLCPRWEQAGTSCAQPGQPHPSLLGVPAVPSCWNLEMDTQNLRILEKCDRNCWMPNSRGTRLLTRFGLGIPAHIWSSWLPPSTPTGSQLDAVLGAKGKMSWQRVVGQLQTPGVTCPASGGISFWQRGSHPAGF